ncbi:MAG: stage II sporulation protein M [Flavihumibacter sp.]
MAYNNIRVAFLMFISGFFAGIGTLYMLFQNGFMLGAFQYYFFAKGLGWASVLVIWIHGTLEISAFVIAGGAGFIIGRSILFPGTFSRMKALKEGARDGVKITLGLVPVFLAAALLEGFITRYTEMPLWLSISILAASLFFMCWYFVWYPARVHAKQSS